MFSTKQFMMMGQLSVFLALILSRFFTSGPAVDFSAGFFTGLSLVFNMAYLIRMIKPKFVKISK